MPRRWIDLEKVFETNIVKKDLRKVGLRFAICYPGEYRVGMSCLAIHTIYSMMNSIKEVACERAFLQPTSEVGTRTLESNVPLRKMDLVGFSLQFEIDYVNVIRMLIDSQIPVLSKGRSDQDPLIIAGGPCATGNPEPLSDFVDIFVVGEAESILPKLVDRLLEIKKPRTHLSEFLDLDGVYIPALNQESVKRCRVEELDRAPHSTSQVVPRVGGKSKASPVFGETFLAEVTRGCCHGCRFCYIGFTGRPYRERSLDKMEEILEEGARRTGVDKVSLIGSSLSDYSNLIDLCGWVVEDQGLNLSVSSLRADSASFELLKILAKGGERTLTIAPETGSEALRRSLNKRITDEDIICTAESALEAGIRNLKLYFMLGLPGEGDQDVQDIASLVNQIARRGYQSRSIRLSIAPFVPKPHTPFQWASQTSVSDLQTRLKRIRSDLGSNPKVDVEASDFRWTEIEALLSIEDRCIGTTLRSVVERGGTLSAWKHAIAATGTNLAKIRSGRAPESRLPWDKIRVGVGKDFLKAEASKAAAGEESPSCVGRRSNCGAC